MSDRLLCHLLTPLCLLGALACAPDTPTELRSTIDAQGSAGGDAPTFLTLAADAPTLATTSVSFYAVRGEEHEVEMWYASQGGADSTRLLRFRVTKKSLCTRADGTPIAMGDSLLITLTVTDPAKQIVSFAPEGLTFCSGRPAKLWMWYAEVDHDLDGDGDEDAADFAIERQLAIWRQATPGAPWTRVTSAVSPDDDEVEAALTGFSGYVVAY